MSRYAALFLCVVAMFLLAVGGKSSTINVSEIKPGMKGYGLTVFRGTKPEKFDVEVIDVLHNFQPDQDLILIKTPHPLLNHVKTVKGMSGSPIYFDGRLAGAYAYGWSFGLDPVAGVTPIATMLKELKRPLRKDTFPWSGALPKKKKSKARALAKRTAPPRSFRKRDQLTSYAPFAGLRAESKKRQISTSMIKPVATPIYVSGMLPDIAESLRKELSPFGLDIEQTGGGGQGTGGPTGFVDGGAIAVQLVRGDVNMTGVGTVTHVDPKSGRLVAFGHPMMNAGEIGLPTATAKVLHILANQAASFKIAEPLKPLGALIHDRPSAIVVDSKLTAGTIPVEVKLNGLPKTARSKWNFEVAEHALLTPGLLGAAIMNAIRTSSSDVTYVAYKVRTTVELENNGTHTYEDIGFVPRGPANPMMLSSHRAFALIQFAYDNPFEKERVKKANFEFTFEFGRKYFEIFDIRVPKLEAEEGETLPVTITLREFGGELRKVVMPVKVPDGTAGTGLNLRIGDGRMIRDPKAIPTSFADVLTLLETKYGMDTLAITAPLPTKGLSFRGHVVDNLPASAIATLQTSTGFGPGQPFYSEMVVTKKMPMVIGGNANLSIKVKEAKQ